MSKFVIILSYSFKWFFTFSSDFFFNFCLFKFSNRNTIVKFYLENNYLKTKNLNYYISLTFSAYYCWHRHFCGLLACYQPKNKINKLRPKYLLRNFIQSKNCIIYYYFLCFDAVFDVQFIGIWWSNLIELVVTQSKEC